MRAGGQEGGARRGRDRVAVIGVARASLERAGDREKCPGKSHVVGVPPPGRVIATGIGNMPVKLTPKWGNELVGGPSVRTVRPGSCDDLSSYGSSPVAECGRAGPLGDTLMRTEDLPRP